ncbi:MAG: CPBP family intramembrane metalloprotease [Betaproteobacteria bacterium]|nr:MAG: CPBP family intramembrane metalloprotease [Betaproteobacteria bacterium]
MLMRVLQRSLPSPHGPMDPATRRVAITLVYTALALTLLEFVFRPAFFIRHFPQWSAPHMGLYPHLWWALGSIAFYLPIPMLIVRFGFGQRLRDFGWRLDVPLRHWILYGVMLLVMMPIVFYAASQPGFLAVYPFFRAAFIAPTQAVLVWELAYLAQFLALEFFFRGFLAIGLGQVLGRAAVWVSVVPYCMIHFHKPLPEALAAIVAGVILAEVAQRTRSIAGGVVVHMGVALTMDLLALRVR